MISSGKQLAGNTSPTHQQDIASNQSGREPKDLFFSLWTCIQYIVNAKASSLVGALALVAVYFCAGKLGLLMADVHSSVSPIWPATGIAMAALLLRGYGFWPAIFVGAFLVNVAVPFPADTTPGIRIAQAAGIAVGNTLEALAG